MKYDYFYEEQSEQFVFYKVPKVLCTEEEFRKLSSDAKLLYGLLLDRVSLSQKNGWIDGEGRVYVVCTLDAIMLSLNCSDKTATKMLVELEKHGLIERKRQGQGKPAIIYVKNFIHSENLRFLTRKTSDSELVKCTTLDSEKVRCNNTDFNNTEIMAGNKMGYIPRSLNHIPARLMDAGKMIIGQVQEKTSFRTFRVEMYLED